LSLNIESKFANLVAKYGEQSFTWHLVSTSEESEMFLQQLRTELNEEHPLYQEKIYKTIARNVAGDDVLFVTEDEEFFDVHLTYSTANTSDFPRFTKFSDLDAALNHIENEYQKMHFDDSEVQVLADSNSEIKLSEGNSDVKTPTTQSKKSKFSDYLKPFIHGLCLGATLLPPGLSIATMAMILGIYEQLINLVSDVFGRKFKSALGHLIPLALGAIFSIAIFSHLILFAIELFPTQTNFLFLGLIVGSIPLLFKTANVKTEFSVQHFIFAIIAAIFIAMFTFFQDLHLFDLDTANNFTQTITLITVGALISASMILPGLSASLLLLVLGLHETLVASLSNLDLGVIGLFAIGGILGLAIGSKTIKILLKKYTTMTNAVCIGMVIGSTVVVFDGFGDTAMTTITAFIAFFIGLAIVFTLNMKTKKS